MKAQTVHSVCQSLADIAPLKLAESWDNVGLLVGDRARTVERVITCLTVTPAVVEEAMEKQVDLIVAHHPLPFRPLQRITADSISGKMLCQLIGKQIAVYSAHTAFDSAAKGINQSWAEWLELIDIGPIVDPADGNEFGSGRVGRLADPVKADVLLRKCLDLVSGNPKNLRAAGPIDQMVSKVGVACGSGGSFVAAAHRRGCTLLVTGEATFHQCLEAESLGMTLGLLGHYHSERFAMETLAEGLSSQFPELSIWPSERESDPIHAIR